MIPKLNVACGVLILTALGVGTLSRSVPAQEPDPSTARSEVPLESLVWTGLQGAPKESRAALAALRKRKVPLEAVQAILDRGPPWRTLPAGLHRIPDLEIPGTQETTECLIRVPAGMEPGRHYPLVLGIHGTGGSAQTAIWNLESALKDRDVILVAPTEAPSIHGQGWGYREREHRLAFAALESAFDHLPVDRSRVYVTGVSRGGHASFDLGVRFTDQFAGIIPISGSLPRRDMPLVENFLATRVFCMLGGQDQPALVRGAEQVFEALKDRHPAAVLHLDPARGHEAFRDVLPTALSMVMESPRDPHPPRLRFALRDLDHGKHYWIKVTRLGEKVWKAGQPVIIPTGTEPDEASRYAAWDQVIAERTARVAARFEADRLIIETRRVSKFEVFIPLRFRPESGKLIVEVDGKVVRRAQRVPLPTAAKLIELSRQAGTTDPTFRYALRLQLKGDRR